MSTVRVLLHLVLFGRKAARGLAYTAVTWSPVLIVSAVTGPFTTGVATAITGVVYLALVASWIGDYCREVADIRRVDWREIQEFRATVKEAGR